MNHFLKDNRNTANQSELGKNTGYDETYNPSRLFPIPRKDKRDEIGINSDKPPFFGFDFWTHYEVSWLNAKGKPIVAIAEIIYNCLSPNIIESKSLKLYFNSLNQSKFESISEVEQVVSNDLTNAVQSPVQVNLVPLNQIKNTQVLSQFPGTCIDNIDVDCSIYTVNPDFLSISHEEVEEYLTSDLLKSNCLVTNQPDWGSVSIGYKGPKINREGLLRYIVSFRNHNEFHEQCIERIFNDILTRCKPSNLSVYGRYTRRGGLDINPYRSTDKVDMKAFDFRLVRQ